VIHETYVGLVLTIFPPSEDSTHSLLMNRPVGWVYFRPLGAVSSTERFDIFPSFRLVFNRSLGRLISLVSSSRNLAFSVKTWERSSRNSYEADRRRPTKWNPRRSNDCLSSRISPPSSPRSCFPEGRQVLPDQFALLRRENINLKPLALPRVDSARSP